MCRRRINLLTASFAKSGLKLLLEFTQHRLGKKWEYALDRLPGDGKPHTHIQFCETRMREYMILQMEAVAVAGSEFRYLLFHVIMF